MRKSLLVILLAVLAALYASLFVVQAWQRGSVRRLGHVWRVGDNKLLRVRSV